MGFKLSKYLIQTDQTERSGTSVLLSTRTAKAVILKKALSEKIRREDWSSLTLDEFDFFKELEIIVPELEDELATMLARSHEAIANVKNLYHVIQPTSVCQLGCGYCGQTHQKGHLNAEHSDKLLLRLRDKLEKKQFNQVSISWFGSEPLTGYPQIQYLAPKLIALAEEYQCQYASNMVTNGLNLSEKIYFDLAKNLGVTSIEVTLDGTAEYHDNRRYTKQGKPTFNQILKNIVSIVNNPDYDRKQCPISIRCNVDKHNEESVIPLINLLAEYRLQTKISHFYAAPVHSWGNDAHLQSLEKQAFANKEIEWFRHLLELGFTLPALLPQLTPIVCLSVVPNNEVIDAFGNVFDCTETPYVDRYNGTNYIQGNLSDNTIDGERPLLSFYDQVAKEAYDCHTCVMLPVCGGGCPKSWVEGIPACPTNKFNIKEKLLLYVATNGAREKIPAYVN